MTKVLSVGDKAPPFTLPSDGGGKVSLKDLLGNPVVLYFYPKDDTSGCTREAIDFTGLLPKFRRKGAAVIGVSKDTVVAHDKFNYATNSVHVVVPHPLKDIALDTLRNIYRQAGWLWKE